MSVFVVKSSSAKMPSSCWGKYRHVAVIETVNGCVPKMISERARGVVRIVNEWRNCNVGITNRCAFAQAMIEAQSLADQLNTI